MDFFAVIIVLLMLMITPSKQQQEWYQPCQAEYFELKIMDFLAVPRWMDKVSIITSPSMIMFHPLLAEQQLWKKPNPWIFQHIRGQPIPGSYLHEDIVLAIRSDNKYLLGYFTFNTGRWHAYKGAEKFFPNPISLGFDGGYRTLVGGWRQLQNLPVGKLAAQQAVSVLYWTDMRLPNMNQLKWSTAGIIVMFIESHRIYPIRNFVDQHWNDPVPSLLPPQLAEYTVNWSNMSCAVNYWNVTKDWSGGMDARAIAASTNIPVRTLDGALNIIFPILRGRNCLEYPPLPPPE